MFVHDKKMTMRFCWLFIGLMVTVLLLAACDSSSALAPTASPAEPYTATPEPPTVILELLTDTPEPPTVTPEPPTATPEPPTATPEPPTVTPEPPTVTPEPPTATPNSESNPGQVDFDQIFPPGHEQERDFVIYSCGSCHGWACAIIGQRPENHWQTIKTNHRDFVSAMNDEDYELLLSFLAENFNDTKPVPDLPEELEGLGCTTQQ